MSQTAAGPADGSGIAQDPSLLVPSGVVPGGRRRWVLMVSGLVLIAVLAVVLWAVGRQVRADGLASVTEALELPAEFRVTTTLASVDEGPALDGSWCLPGSLACWVTDLEPAETIDALEVALARAGAHDVEGECPAGPSAPDGRPLVCQAWGTVGRGPVSLHAVGDVVPVDGGGLERGVTTVALLDVPRLP